MPPQQQQQQQQQQTRAFPPEVFARLAPELYFKRHLDAGSRPCGRGLLEKRTATVKQGDSQALRHSLGSAVARAGGAVVVCGITGGLTRYRGEGGIYANVEIHRGGSVGNPSGEEQVLTMATHRLVEAARIDREQFVVDDEQELCLSAQIIVLSRTGPMQDLVWACLVNALRATKLPIFEQDERTLELKPTAKSKPLELPASLADLHETYGLSNGVVLADLDGSVEEECVINRVSLAKSSATGLYSGVSICAPEGCDSLSLEKIISNLESASP